MLKMEVKWYTKNYYSNLYNLNRYCIINNYPIDVEVAQNKFHIYIIYSNEWLNVLVECNLHWHNKLLFILHINNDAKPGDFMRLTLNARVSNLTHVHRVLSFATHYFRK